MSELVCVYEPGEKQAREKWAKVKNWKGCLLLGATMSCPFQFARFSICWILATLWFDYFTTNKFHWQHSTFQLKLRTWQRNAEDELTVKSHQITPCKTGGKYVVESNRDLKATLSLMPLAIKIVLHAFGWCSREQRTNVHEYHSLRIIISANVLPD